MPTILDEIKYALEARTGAHDTKENPYAHIDIEATIDTYLFDWLRWAARLAEAAKRLPEHVDLTEFLDSHDADLPGWALRFHWCLFCGYKEPDGHYRDCPVNELRRILNEEAADETE